MMKFIGKKHAYIIRFTKTHRVRMDLVALHVEQLYAPINGLPQDRGGGNPRGI